MTFCVVCCGILGVIVGIFFVSNMSSEWDVEDFFLVGLMGLMFSGIGAVVGDFIFADDIRAEREAKLYAIADDPKAWLCGEVKDASRLDVDGLTFVIDKKIGELEKRADDFEGGERVAYGSAIGALKREREAILEFGLKAETCGRVK